MSYNLLIVVIGKKCVRLYLYLFIFVFLALKPGRKSNSIFNPTLISFANKFSFNCYIFWRQFVFQTKTAAFHTFEIGKLSTHRFLLLGANMQLIFVYFISETYFSFLCISFTASISRFGRGDATEESKEAKSLLSHLTEHAADQPPFLVFLSKAIIFGFIMLYFWLCDYQHIW